MKRGLCLVIALFCYLLSMHIFAEVQVVDDSENFALTHDEQAEITQPVAKYAQEVPLAHENTSTMKHGQKNLMLLNKVQGMQQEIQDLRGQLEVQLHEIKVLREQQLEFYKDLDNRLRNAVVANKATQMPNDSTKISNTQSDTSVPAFAITTPAVAHKNPADEQITYMAAYELIKNKHFDAALSAMQAFVLQYPNGGYTANAQYWLGELYLVRKDYAQAMQPFRVVLQQFPHSSKAAASMLKLGYALAASGKSSEAQQTLQQVLKNYPDTPTAQLAANKLQTLRASS
jgi:tol-pal system protein YbgF